jgi:histidyl-tRNA synthetase
MQALPGFRDFYPDDCARRNYILSTWREVAHRYGFVEFDGPTVESLALYEKKSGGELVGQLFTVSTIAGRGAGESSAAASSEAKGALRPEMTPTLARMVAAREREFKKPLKWFCVPQFFRHERQQRGRLREFHQLNCDIIGEASPAADAEMIALSIDMLRGLGFTEADFVVRLSSRTAWQEFFRAKLSKPDGSGPTEEDEYEFFQVVDKAERNAPEKTDAALARFGISAEQVLTFLRSKDPTAELLPIVADLQARGLGAFVEIDYAIVRGLAYYTGVVFELFDRSKNERALAGGGRYDKLLQLMSDGKVDLPALGFGMGDVVLGNLINDTPAAAELMNQWLARKHAADVFVIVAKEERRPDALRLVQELRESGLRVDFPLTGSKVGKQFQAAENAAAQLAVVIGDEWPQLKLKALASREEIVVDRENLAAELTARLRS